jgi:hypothetical protein
MVSRAHELATSVLATLVLVPGIAVVGADARQPPTGTAMYVVRHDQRLCPSPRCGGYWIAIANGARTRCADGLRHVRCYAARAVDAHGRLLPGEIAEGALVRGALGPGRDDLGELLALAVYAPAGTAAGGGGYYRLVATDRRCVRAPCFAHRATQVNGSTRTPVSDVELEASGAAPAEIARARRALRSPNGLYARGRLARTAAGGTVFRALRLYLRAPLPRA